jgi:hypothetical protein
MKFKFKLAYYLIGLMLGVYFVTQFLQSKAEASGVEFCYFPNCRVLQDIRKKPFDIDSVAQATLDEKWVNLDDIKNTLKYGDVDFSKSNKPYKRGKLYIIEGKTSQNQAITLSVINFENRAVLENIKKE